MKIQIGNTTFTAAFEDLPFLTSELGERLRTIKKKTENGWDCALSSPAPAPVIRKMNAPFILGVHAADFEIPLSALGGMMYGAPPTPQEQAILDRRARDVAQKSANLYNWFRYMVTGALDDQALDQLLSNQFGAKKDLEIPYDALIKDHKDRFSLHVESTPDYEYFRLKHPRMPASKEAKLYLLVPVGLEHRVYTTAECTERGKQERKHWREFGPVKHKAVPADPVSDGERAMRKLSSKARLSEARKKLKRAKRLKKEAEQMAADAKAEIDKQTKIQKKLDDE